MIDIGSEYESSATESLLAWFFCCSSNALDKVNIKVCRSRFKNKYSLCRKRDKRHRRKYMCPVAQEISEEG